MDLVSSNFIFRIFLICLLAIMLLLLITYVAEKLGLGKTNSPPPPPSAPIAPAASAAALSPAIYRGVGKALCSCVDANAHLVGLLRPKTPAQHIAADNTGIQGVHFVYIFDREFSCSGGGISFSNMPVADIAAILNSLLPNYLVAAGVPSNYRIVNGCDLGLGKIALEVA